MPEKYAIRYALIGATLLDDARNWPMRATWTPFWIFRGQALLKKSLRVPKISEHFCIAWFEIQYFLLWPYREGNSLQPIKSTTQVWLLANTNTEYLRSFLRRHFAWKPVVESPNVGCFLRLPTWERPEITASKCWKLNTKETEVTIVRAYTYLYLSWTFCFIPDKHSDVISRSRYSDRVSVAISRSFWLSCVETIDTFSF